MWYERLRPHVESLLAHDFSSFREEMWEVLQKKDPHIEKKKNYPYLDFDKLFFFQPFFLSQTKKIEKKAVAPFLFDPSFYHIVFVDGIFDKKLSSIPSEVHVIDNFFTDERFFSLWQKSKEEEKKNFFSLVNAVLFSKAEGFHIPENTVLSKPLHILHILTGDGRAVFPKIYVSLGKNAKAEIILSTSSMGKMPLFHQSVDFFLDHNAQLNLHSVTAPSQGIFLENIRCFLKKESSMKATKISLSKNLCLFDAKVLLEECKASFNLQAVSLVDKKAQDHSRILLEHLAPFTKSEQKWKKILLQRSLSSFIGDITIHPEAQKSVSSQLNPHLLLQDPAWAYSKPELRIFADDVKASHGATMFQVQERPLFYLRSRGLSYQKAFALLLEGYYKEIIDQVTIDSVKKDVETQMQEMLSKDIL